MLIFAFHIIKDHIDEVLNATKQKEGNNIDAAGPRREQSCLLLEKEPGR